MVFAIRNAEYVEVVVPSGSTKQTYYFPDLPNLRNRPITGIETFSSYEQSKGQSGAAIVAPSTLVKAFLTLYFDGGEFIQVPLKSIHRVSADSNAITQQITEIPTLAGQNIVWTKSYVQFNDSVVAGTNFLFAVYYNR